VSAVTPSSARPARPQRSLALPAGIAVFIVITLLSLSEQFGIGFDLGALIEDIGRGSEIIGELLSPNWEFLPRTIRPMIETIQMAILAAVLGCSMALPVAFLASRVTAPNRIVLNLDRGVLSVVRAIPDILYALIFVAAIGVGPLPGIVALILFNIGVVAKLLSETVDGVDRGPIEAAQASAATRTQTVRWAVLPQVLPHYVAYSLYAFELNVRASTVIGIVGAGGIGQLLYTQYQFFAWSNVSVIVIELFIAVLVIELLSIALRRRLT
jgi:phosphonate transport system permease protein